MPLYRHKDRAILLVHIPKTGGSSIEEMLVEAGALQALKFHKRFDYSACTPQHMHWEVLSRWVPNSFYNFSLTIVRNPFDRLASEYAWRTHLSGEPIEAFNAWVRTALKRYQQNPYIHDNHIRPQVEFVGPKVKVFKLEDGLNPAAKMAFRRLGITYRKPKLPHVRKSAHEILEIEQSLLEQIRAFYAEDFVTFGYNLEEVPQHLFRVIPDPVPEPEPEPIPEPDAPTYFQPPPPAAPRPLWRRALGKVKRHIKAALK